MGTIVIDKNQFSVDFKFTTVHAGSRFTGREGTLGLETTTCTVEEMWQDAEHITQLCINYVLHEKPKWKILSLQITGITEIKKIQEIVTALS